MSYKLSDTFKENVKNKDNLAILSSFSVFLNTDRSFEEGKVDTAIEYLRKYYPEFIKPDRNEDFKEKSEWTEDYWNEISASLYNYFSLEKIKLLREMSKKLYPIRKIQLDKVDKEAKIEKKFAPALAIAIIAGAVVIIAGIIIAAMKK